VKAISPPDSGTAERLFSDPKSLADAMRLLPHPLVRRINRSYKPWREVRPIATQEGLDPEVIWNAVKFMRHGMRRPLPLARAEGGTFGYAETPIMREWLHRIDQTLGGGGVAALDSHEGVISAPAMRTRFAIRSMMEEAIESSRIEGALTTRIEALNLLRSQRPPQTNHERMVTNNYAAMQRIKTWLNRELTEAMLHELQGTLTEGTLDDPAHARRFRLPGEPVRVEDDRTGEVIFTPPSAANLPERVGKILQFANQKHTGDAFIHPIVKACILHFMIGYEHPYCDGNGRTARAIFYWFVLKSGYSVFEYMAVSELIRKSFAKYGQAYLNTELDEGDLTYFVFYKLRIISRAIDSLAEHLAREEAKVQRSLQLAASDPGVNLRQRLLLEHAIRHPKTVYTVKSHAISNRITSNTSRADLEGLVSRGFLKTYKAGRTVSYVLAPEAHDRLGVHGR
jgi:Fic family protein